MFFLSLLPTEWLYYSMIAAGVVLYFCTFFLRFIPFFYVYKTPLQLISIVMLVAGSFLYGMYIDSKIWKAEAEKMQAKLAVAEEKSKQENVKIVTQIVTKTQVIKQRGDDIVKYIDREIVKYDDQCIIPKAFVDAHNQAAEAPK